MVRPFSLSSGDTFHIDEHTLASNIYGSENCEAKRLRLNKLGKLNSTSHQVYGLKDLLPQISTHAECKAPSGYCFLAGDLRASEQPSLACK